MGRSGYDRRPEAVRTCGAVLAPAMLGHRERASAVADTAGRSRRFRLLIDIEQAVKIETACHGCGNLWRIQIKSAKKAAR